MEVDIAFFGGKVGKNREAENDDVKPNTICINIKKPALKGRPSYQIE